MSKRNDSILLRDMLSAIDSILEYTLDVTFEGFLENKMLRDAVYRNFEVLGEASNRLSDLFLLEHPEVNWRRISGLRNRIIHAYFEVDDEIVWEIIRNEIPLLKDQITKILADN